VSCPCGCAEFFDEKSARRDAKRYRRKGLDGTARRMVAFLAERGLENATVLEIGGGVGAVQIELLRAGADRAVNLELSPAYEPAASELVREAALGGRVERRVANIVEEGGSVEPADVLVMHRVVCCYPDPEALVGAAADHARRYLVMSFPRETALLRVGVRLANLWIRLRGIDFRAYVHPPAAILGAAERRGLRPVLEHRGAIWQFAALERTPA
jgi:magnesium-protoporphyrin O-methyltransferase